MGNMLTNMTILVVQTIRGFIRGCRAFRLKRARKGIAR